jgi:hypothetical protein
MRRWRFEVATSVMLKIPASGFIETSAWVLIPLENTKGIDQTVRARVFRIDDTDRNRHFY